MDERRYYEGVSTGLRRYYQEEGEPAFELEFNFHGQLVRVTNYDISYDGFRHEILYTPEKDLEKDFSFRADGTLDRMIMHRGWVLIEEKYYNSSEALIHHKAYYEEGVSTLLLDSLAKDH
jgi:hypothetical protein